MLRSEKLKKLSLWGLYFLLFLPLLVYNNALFPFVFLKAFAFRFVVEALFLLAIFLLFRGEFYKIIKNPPLIFLGLFFLLFPLISLFSINGLENWWGNFERMEGGFYYLHLLIYFLLLVNFFRTDKIWEKVFLFITSSSFLISIFAIMQKVGAKLWFYNYAGRVGGTVGNAAYLASALVVCLGFLVFFFYKYKKYRWFSGTTIFLNIITILISATRGSILALLAVGFLWFISSLLKKDYLRAKSRKWLASLFILFILSSASVFIFKDSSFVQNIEWLRRMSDISLSETTANSRLIAWDYSWQAFQAKPWFGWGVENYDIAFNRYFDHRMDEDWFDRAHNNYLDILVTGGIFVFLIYLVFICSVFWFIWCLYKKQRINFLSWQIFTFTWLAYLIQNIFIFDTVNTLIFVLVFVAFLTYLDNFDKEFFVLKYDINLNKKIKNGLSILFVLIFILVLNASVIRPVRANLLAFDAYQTFVDKDFELSLQKIDTAVKLSYNNFGVNDILLGFYRVLEPDLKQLPHNILLRTIDLFAQNKLDIRSKIKMISMDIYSMTNQVDELKIQRDIDILSQLSAEESPRRRALYSQFGQLYALRGDKETSISYFQKSVEIKKDVDSLWNLATAYFYLKDFENFEKQARYLVDGNYELGLEDLKLLVNYFENNKQDNEMLEKIFVKVVNYDRTANNLFDLAVVKVRLKKMEEARAILAEAIELEPKLEIKAKQLLSL